MAAKGEDKIIVVETVDNTRGPPLVASWEPVHSTNSTITIPRPTSPTTSESSCLYESDDDEDNLPVVSSQAPFSSTPSSSRPDHPTSSPPRASAPSPSPQHATKTPASPEIDIEAESNPDGEFELEEEFEQGTQEADVVPSEDEMNVDEVLEQHFIGGAAPFPGFVAYEGRWRSLHRPFQLSVEGESPDMPFEVTFVPDDPELLPMTFDVGNESREVGGISVLRQHLKMARNARVFREPTMDEYTEDLVCEVLFLSLLYLQLTGDSKYPSVLQRLPEEARRISAIKNYTASHPDEDWMKPFVEIPKFTPPIPIPPAPARGPFKFGGNLPAPFAPTTSSSHFPAPNLNPTSRRMVPCPDTLPTSYAELLNDLDPEGPVYQIQTRKRKRTFVEGLETIEEEEDGPPPRKRKGLLGRAVESLGRLLGR